MTSSSAHNQVWRLSWAVVLLAFVTIAASGIDFRPGTVAGGCSGWGDCSGWEYLSRSHGAIGTGHLVVAGITSVATAVLVGLSWLRLRGDHRVITAATLAFVATSVQGVAIFVPAESALVHWAASLHLGATAVLLGTGEYLVALPMLDRLRASSATRSTRRVPAGYRALVFAVGVTVFAVLVSGAFVSASDSAAACSGWPLCDESGQFFTVEVMSSALVHRLLVFVSSLLLAGLAFATMRTRDGSGLRGRIVAGLVLLFLVDTAIGAATIADGRASSASVGHFAVAGGAWALVVLLGLVTAADTMTQIASQVEPRAARRPYFGPIRDYIRVTKPGIMLLLLTTTLGAMLVAASGWPSTALVAATLVGGILASGGASALNCYLDRDIDMVMARTRRRPLPTGRLEPKQVRNFGLLLSALAVLDLAVFVNPVAALLALGGNLFYVVVYTRWLKRATPQNIVIGGAAGAFPPLVGWAAVTGTVGVPALLLFAIIFYWTPPHFWSLALLKARDYERAGIPMMPVTHGDEHTRKFIVLYAILLCGVTLLPAVTGTAGLLYLFSALMLGGVFVALALRMYMENSSRLAWRLFKFSNYYLALLLAMMVLDRVLQG